MQKQPSLQGKTTPKITTKLPTAINSRQQFSQQAHLFQDALKNIHQKRNQAQNSYEKVISALEQVVQELVQKNKFLVQDREGILKDNYELRRRNESLESIIDVKERLRCSGGEQGDIFEILVETPSLTGRMSKIEESIEEEQVDSAIEHNSHILNRQEFIIMSNPLSYNVSQYQYNQISMSNIGKTQTVIENNNMKTPGLSKQNIYIQCNSSKADGIIRTFYLSLIQRKDTARIFIELIDSLTNDLTIILYQPYPTNEFWTEMLCNFLKIIHEGHFDSQLEVLEYIKIHRLIDTLLIKCLKTRIQFIFENRDVFDTPSVQEIFRALSNQFNLRMELLDNQYLFFTKEVKDEKLLLSERASLDISLNNKSENKYYIREEEACFIIYERENQLQLPFFILIESDLGLSQYELREERGEKNNQSFRYSEEERNDSIQLRMKGISLGGDDDHLDGIASILNQKDLNIWDGDQPKLTRKPCHRRYEHNINKLPYNYQQPLSSSRYFLHRVASGKSSINSNS